VESTPQLHERHEPLIGGVVLIVIGAALLLSQLVPEIGRYVVLGIGLLLLAAFAVRRNYGALVGGSIVTGVGVGVALAPMFSGTMAAAVLLVSIGLGFIAIWLVSLAAGLGERNWWPLVPGLIIVSVGGALGIGGSAVNLLAYWPIVLIVVGVILLAGALFRRQPASR
jgi:hypothetical protein